MGFYEWLSLFVSIVAIIHEIANIRNHDLSFIFRYLLVFFLFQNLQIFSNNIINYMFLETISIGYIIYVISFKMVGVIMAFSSNYDRDNWKIIYLIIYTIISLILFFIMRKLQTEGYIPIN